MRLMVKLQVYVNEECWSCHESRKIVAEIAPQFPDVKIELLDLNAEEHPDFVFAVPTYVLNGRIISLGNPYREDLRRRLRASISNDGM